MTLDEILEDVGVRVIRPNETRRTGDTCASTAIRKIYDQHGDGHLALVLRLLCETRPANRDAIVGPVIWALSDLILGQPKFVDAGLRLFEAFDSIDLTALLDIARCNKDAVALRAAIATLVYERLSDALFPAPPQQVSPSLKGQMIRLAAAA